jgi:hypothetical protein
MVGDSRMARPTTAVADCNLSWPGFLVCRVTAVVKVAGEFSVCLGAMCPGDLLNDSPPSLPFIVCQRKDQVRDAHLSVTRDR